MVLNESWIVVFVVLGFVLTWSLFNYIFDHLLIKWRFPNLTRQEIDNIDRMPVDQFEKFLHKMFVGLGYQIDVPHRKGLQNYFVIVKDEVSISVRFYKKSTTQRVGTDAIYHVLTGKAYSQCQKALVISNTWFTTEALKVATKEGVEVWERSRLFHEITRNEVLREFQAKLVRL